MRLLQGAAVKESLPVDRTRLCHQHLQLKTGEYMRDEGGGGASQTHKGLIAVLQPSHTHTNTHPAGSPQRGKHVPIVRGSHEPPCSFSPDNSCIDNTYQLEQYKRRGRRHRKGTKRHRGEKALQLVNGYRFTSLWCRTFLHIRVGQVLHKNDVFLLSLDKNNEHSTKKLSYSDEQGKKEGRGGGQNSIPCTGYQSGSHSISQSVSQTLMGEVGHAQNKPHEWVTPAFINQSIWQVIHTSTPSFMEIICKPAAEH